MIIKEDDPRLDKFYDETPQVRFTFNLNISTENRPYQLHYAERLDGDAEYNAEVIKKLRDRAQADMHNILQRLQARDPDCEFVSWQQLDDTGAVLFTSDQLVISVIGKRARHNEAK